MNHCKNCEEWGVSINRLDNPSAVPCPVCGRLTWPNLGVNLPAGAAVSVSGIHAQLLLRVVQPPETLFEKLQRFREEYL